MDPQETKRKIEQIINYKGQNLCAHSYGNLISLRADWKFLSNYLFCNKYHFYQGKEMFSSDDHENNTHTNFKFR